MNLLYANLLEVQFNHYNLELYLSIAKLCRQNLMMLNDLKEINTELEKAQDQAAKLHYQQAVEALDAAIDIAEESGTNAIRHSTCRDDDLV